MGLLELKLGITTTATLGAIESGALKFVLCVLLLKLVVKLQKSGISDGIGMLELTSQRKLFRAISLISKAHQCAKNQIKVSK